MPSGFRFRKEFQILPGVRINISKTGASVSLGPSDVHITTGTHGTTMYLDLPGSGAYYRKKLDTKTDSDRESLEEKQRKALELGFFERLVTPADEAHLVDALRAFVDGNLNEAYENATGAAHLADGAFLAGFLALRMGHYEQARDYLERALEQRDRLGKHFDAYELDVTVALPITEDTGAAIMPDERGVLLALAEVYQEIGMWEAALNCLQRLHDLDPQDIVVRLSLAEVLYAINPDSEDTHKQIVQLAEGLHNESPVHASLMYYRARALRELGLQDGARDTLTKALRRKKGYPRDLLHALRYERALIYQADGKKKRAHEEFEKIYAEAPGFEDVAARLGL